MLCHPDISLPANYALQIRMSLFRVGYDFVNLMAADHSRLAYKAIPTDLEGQA